MSDPSQPANLGKSPRRLRRILLIAGIVVLVVIVALIAIPNHMHPAIRARNSTVQAEMRDIAVALEAFRVAHGRLPTVREFYTADRLPNAIPDDDPPIEFTLTSPVAFIAALPGDPYDKESRKHHYFYFADVDICWILASRGPDRDADFFSGKEKDFRNERMFAFGEDSDLPACDPHFFYPEGQQGVRGMGAMLFDPSNGLESNGDIIKTGP